MKRPITIAILALALSTTAAVARQPAGQQPAAKPATQQPAAKPAATPGPAKAEGQAPAAEPARKKHGKHAAKPASATRMDSSAAEPKK